MVAVSVSSLILLFGLTAPSAIATTLHYCDPCTISYGETKEGPVRHSYVLNYGHVVSSGSGWIGVSANSTNHQPYGSNAQGWGSSTHSYSGSNLLYMVVANIFDDGVGNYYSISANAHGNY
jgi:hypothetical protein